MAELNAAAVDDLPDDVFAFIEPGGRKDAGGKTTPRSLRHFPVHDKAHVQDALARAPQSPFGDKAMPAIKAAAKKFGVDVSDGDVGSSRSAAGPVPYTRSFGLEEVFIRAGGDGRTVDAYAAVFDTPSHIRDQDGEYNEVIDRTAFNKAIADASPTGTRRAWRCGVFYNHGMTIWETPSDLHSMPIGTVMELRADSRGLFSSVRYHPGERCDQILEGIRSGAIPGYSFAGSFLRSDPTRSRLEKFRPDSAGNLRTVRRLECSLRELGPTPFPAYAEAAVVGVRAQHVASMVATMDPFERQQLVELLGDGSSPTTGTPSDGGAAAVEPRQHGLETHSGRPPRDELRRNAARFIERHGGQP